MENEEDVVIDFECEELSSDDEIKRLVAELVESFEEEQRQKFGT